MPSPRVFLRKGVYKFTGEYPYRSVTSIKLLCSKVVRTSAWVFSCKFAAYFQNTFSKEHLWAAASAFGWRPLDTVDSTLFFVPPKTFLGQLVNYTLLRYLKAINCGLTRKKGIGRSNWRWEEYQQRRDEVRHFIECMR